MHLDEPESKFEVAICSISPRLNKMEAPHFRNQVEKIFLKISTISHIFLATLSIK